MTMQKDNNPQNYKDIQRVENFLMKVREIMRRPDGLAEASDLTPPEMDCPQIQSVIRPELR